MKFKKVFLHIGHDKTGSTALQETLFLNRELLESWGVAYGGGSKYEAEIKGKAVPTNDFSLWQHFFEKEGGVSERTSAYLKALEWRAKEAATPYLVLSHEGLFHLRDREVHALHEYLYSIAEQVVVIVYVRTPLAYAISALSQGVKVGRRLNHVLPYKTYERSLKRWASVFGREQVAVRAYRRDSDAGFDVIADFLNASVLTCVPEARLSLLKEPKFTGRPSLSGMGMRTGDRIIELLGNSCPTGREFRGTFYAHLAALGAEPFPITASQLRDLKNRCRDQLAYLAREFDVSFESEPYLVEPAAPCPDAEVEAAARRIIKEVMPGHKVDRNLLKGLKRSFLRPRGPFFQAVR